MEFAKESESGNNRWGVHSVDDRLGGHNLRLGKKCRNWDQQKPTICKPASHKLSNAVRNRLLHAEHNKYLGHPKKL